MSEEKNMKKKIVLRLMQQFQINFEGEFEFNNKPMHYEVLKYFRLQFKTKELFYDRVFDTMVTNFKNIEQDYINKTGQFEPPTDPDQKEITEVTDAVMEEFKNILFPFIDKVMAEYETIEPYSYTEAFEIKDDPFRALVFGSINIADMISDLGHTLYKTDGIELEQKQFDAEGNFVKMYTLNNIYEVHKVNGKKLIETNVMNGFNMEPQTDIWAIKCWCTSTNDEHWIWIEEEYKDDPLSAIASTFRFHKSVIPNIKEIKRQGDMMIVEMKKEVTPTEGEEVVPLTKKQYFSLLTAQT